MRITWWRAALATVALSALMVLWACGGGSNSGGSTPTPPSTPSLVITTDSGLPGTLEQHAYSATLTAANGVGALTWSISPISPTALFVDGLSIDPSSGLISGTVNFSGTAGFIAKVTDSASHSASKSFNITASLPLAAPPPRNVTLGQYSDVRGIFLGSFAGVQPLRFAVSSGPLPPGVKLRTPTENGEFIGIATTIGTFPVTVTVQDSFSPPEVVTAQITFDIIPAGLQLPSNALPATAYVNRSFNSNVVAIGGIPPYKYVRTHGTLPPGLNAIDQSTGQLNGTPTTAGSYVFEVTATDSNTPPQSVTTNFGLTIVAQRGRNDTVATATPVDNGLVDATISPYIDPPGTTPVAGDNDYYKLVSLSGAMVHVETLAERRFSTTSLDTVLEIVDGNNVQLTTCRLPNDTTNNFSSTCISDDVSSNPFVPDSGLDVKVPGSTNVATTFYAHVLDWRGDARPDFRYALNVSGLVAPLSIPAFTLLPAARGKSYSQQLPVAAGIGSTSWTLIGGNLPQGLSLASSGAITGSATSNGTYSFSAKVMDSGTPAQSATAQASIKVVDPVKITSAAVWPDACVNQPYSFTMTTTGGAPPYQWSFFSNFWVLPLDQTTGVFSGSPGITGTFTGTVGVGDATNQADSQQVQITVKQCP
jgi:hypothetical protein